MDGRVLHKSISIEQGLKFRGRQNSGNEDGWIKEFNITFAQVPYIDIGTNMENEVKHTYDTEGNSYPT